MEKIDYKKEFKELYLPKQTPVTVEVPPILFLMINGKGNPNDTEGEYGKAVELLYALSYTIKMSKMGDFIPNGYFDYVVPPLEGLWWLENEESFDFTRKDRFLWTSMIRQPEFVTQEVFAWACSEVKRKKGLVAENVRLEPLTEGLCVQCMHIGPFDKEPETTAKMEEYISQNNLVNDLSPTRRHHEIYLVDPRKIAPEKNKVVLRVPVRNGI